MTKKAKFKGSIDGIDEYDSFIIGVSMGAKRHTGQAFQAAVDCINRSSLTLQGIVDVSDSLKRFTFMLDMSEEQAHEKANKKGQEWIEENAEALDQFRMPVHAVHWDKWLKDKRFPIYLEQFEKAHEDCPELKAAIAEDINNFYCRKFSDAANNPEAHDLSVRFYLEELAVMSIQFEDHNAAQIYIGTELNCLKLIREGKVPNIPKGIENSKFYRLNVYDPKVDGKNEERNDTQDLEEMVHG